MSTTAPIKATRSFHTAFKYPHPAGGFIRIDVETERVSDSQPNQYRSQVSRTHLSPQNGNRQWEGTLHATQIVNSRSLYLAHQEACFYVEALFGFDDE